MLFPVETTVREIDFRLILAILTARPGWQILVGEHELLFKLSLRIQNLVAVIKNVTGGKRPWKYQRWKKLKHRIVNLDEEGSIYREGPERWKEKLDKRITVTELEADDYVCTWGQFQADHYRSLKPACAENITATGHPRFDLCRPAYHEVYDDEVRSLRQAHGKFILVNTNIIASNVGGRDISFRLNQVSPDQTEKRTFFVEQYCHEAHREACFIDMVNHLSNDCPDHNIIFRPHPSEDSRAYQAIFKYIPRVTVTREGSLHAWLKSCQVLIHDGCTTAVEAYLSGTAVINFHPLKDPRFEITLPNLVGLTCSTPQQVTHAVREIDQGRSRCETSPENLAKLTSMIRNFDAEWDSFAAIAKVIGSCQDDAQDARLIGSTPLLVWHRLTDPLRQLAKPWPWLHRLLNRSDRGNNKFPPLDRDEIRKKLALFEKITGKAVAITFHSSKLFSITTR
jgi:surface carbohydrate biosynthesis protein